jgi:hypothetical protein
MLQTPDLNRTIEEFAGKSIYEETLFQIELLEDRGLSREVFNYFDLKHILRSRINRRLEVVIFGLLSLYVSFVLVILVKLNE